MFTHPWRCWWCCPALKQVLHLQGCPLLPQIIVRCPVLCAACSAVLFCSPEVYTSNHKTELTDAAYDAVLKRLGAPSSRRASEEDLFVWSCEEHSWLPSGAATRLLLKHHKSHWAALVRHTRLM